MRKTIFIGLASIVSATAFAQMDNVVEVENNYRPVVKDANKINTLPEIEQPQVSHYNVNYTTAAIPTTNYVFQPMWAAKNEQLIRSDKKGFATAAYGIDNNIFGRVAYGLDLSDNDELKLEFFSRGHNSEVDHITGNRKWDNRFFTNRLKAGYEHRFDTDAILSIDGCYGTDVFNYQSPVGGLGYTDKQQNDLLDLSAELTPYSFGKFGLGASVEFSMFNQKYVTSLADQAKEVGISGSLTPTYQLNDDISIDLEACIDYTNYSMTGFGDGTTFDFTPHVYWKSDEIDLKAGVYVDNDLNVAPDVDVTFHLHPRFDLYLQAEGGRVCNDFRRFAHMTPYWCMNIADADFGEHFFANANLRYNYRNKVMAGLDASYHKWSTDFEANIPGVNTTNWDKIVWRPQLELGCNLMVKPIEQLTIGADFLFESFEKKTNRYERPNTVNLGASISYTFPFRLTLYVKGDNLLNQKYDQYVMYRTPGINFLAGAAITF